MIGVISEESERDAVAEFFELFKTPWEFFQEGGAYEVVVSSAGSVPGSSAQVLIIFGTRQSDLGAETQSLRHSGGKIVLDLKGREIPIYGDVAVYDHPEPAFLKVHETGEPVGIKYSAGDKRYFQIGIDLFKEIEYLLLYGQPPRYAHIPTLELYIAMLRDCILNSGLSLMEIPPVPAGYDFICCLTHDVDFAGIRPHFFDGTMFGFVYRALAGSFFNLVRGRSSSEKLPKNWKAVLKLPAVYAGLAKDIWDDIPRYLELEEGLGGTYFFIPFNNRPGETVSGTAPGIRACKYDLASLRDRIKALVEKGCEVGVHGIDAWKDPEKGRQEYDRIQAITGTGDMGIRMHWLYFDVLSPRSLERTGFSYDSSAGYNEAVGYRSGTTQVYRPPGATGLLEIPLHVQDTALFYKDRMNLTEAEAFGRVREILDDTQKLGGVLTINWHVRSLSPERLWDGFYAELLKELKGRKVWFATARQVVAWFCKRRSVSLYGDPVPRAFQGTPGGSNGTGPDLVFRVHDPISNHVERFLQGEGHV